MIKLKCDAILWFGNNQYCTGYISNFHYNHQGKYAICDRCGTIYSESQIEERIKENRDKMIDVLLNH